MPLMMMMVMTFVRQSHAPVSLQESPALLAPVVRLSFRLSSVRRLCRRCRFRLAKRRQESCADADIAVVAALTM